ncbi:MAG: DUF368 domain-containing protein, partial [Dehalococcoidia bacterium]
MARSFPRGDTPPSWPRHALNVLRGALIGIAETVPGVSGGTIALVVGVYEAMIASGGHLLSAVRMGGADIARGRGQTRATGELRQVHWGVIIALLCGMVPAVLLLARFMEGWVQDYPVQTRALFFGLVLASLWVPFSLSTRTPEAGRAASRPWGWRDAAIALAAAALAYVLVSLPPADVPVTPPVIILAAAIAVSALVLPGLSGSFLLLTFGLYERTLSAVNGLDFGYLGLFLLGAVIGLASIVKVLEWLLERRRRITLVVLTGLMAGSLRALWPWQDDNRAILAPDE